MQLGDGLRNLGLLDHLASQDSPIHRLDSRVKVATTLVFLVVLASHPSTAISALVPYTLFPVYLASVGKIPTALLLRRVALTFPFVLTLALFNPLLDTHPAFQLGPVVLSRGWLSCCSILLRFGLAVASTTALSATTGISRLCEGLEGLGAPRAAVLQVAFLHRYTFLLMEEGMRMHRARELRANGRRLGLRGAADLLGHLLLRAWDRGTRIHAAMLARGFEGRLITGSGSRLPFRDLGFAAGWILIFALFRWVDVPAWIGGRLTP